MRLSEVLNWHVFEEPRVIALTDGGFMTTLSIRGPDISLADDETRLHLVTRIEDICRGLGPRWTWHFESQQTALQGYQSSEFSHLVAQAVDAERRERCEAEGQQFEMRHYLTLAQAPRPGGGLRRLVTTGLTEDATTQARNAFKRAVAELVKALKTVVKVEAMSDDHIATFLHSTISLNRQRVRADDHEILRETLPDSRFVRGVGLSRLGDHIIAVMTLGGFPRTAHPQQLAALSALPFEFRWVTRWVGMERLAAKELMKKREETALGSTTFLKDILLRRGEKILSVGGGAPKHRARVDREQSARADDAADAMETLSDRGYGSMTTVFVVWAKIPLDSKGRAQVEVARQLCEDRRQELATKLRDANLVVRHEAIEPVAPWLASLPGYRKLGRRTYPVSSRNLADLLPTSSIYRGTPYDAQLAKKTGVKRAWLYTADPLTYRFCTDDVSGAAHAALFGRTGEAAKSTLLNHLGLQFFGWPEAQIISISVGRSELGPCLMCDGAVYSPGDTSALAMQPLAFIDDPDERLQAEEWLHGCVEAVGELVTTERRLALSKALGLLADEPSSRRTMTELHNVLQTACPELAEILRPYTLYGEYGRIFDGNSAHALQWQPWTMIDVSRLVSMRAAAAGPAMSHLLWRVFRRFDGRPTFVPLDELPDWGALPGAEKAVTRIIDTQRKNEVRALIVAQTPGQLRAMPTLLSSVKSSVGSRIYGPDSQALSQRDEFAAMEVSEPQLKKIKDLDRGEYMHVRKRGARVFDLNAGNIALALTTMSSKEELALLADMQARGLTGDEIMRAVLRFKAKDLDADLEAHARRLGVWDSKSMTTKLARGAAAA
jgi:type IV secretion system protein VirB4